MEKLRFEKSRALFKRFINWCKKRHTRQKDVRVLSISASFNRLLKTNSNHRIRQCNGCFCSYDVVIIAKGKYSLFNNFRGKQSTVFVRKGEISKFCPHCWERFGFEQLAERI